MAEEDPIFDTTFMQKKKKKKKTTFDLEAALAVDGPESGSAAPSDTQNASSHPDDGEGGDDAGGVDFNDDLDLETFGKKKKSKSSSQPAVDKDKDLGGGPDDGENQEEDFDLDMDFSMMKKKKKTKKRLDDLMVEEEERTDDKENVEDANSSWAGSDRDYTYDELLKRVFEIILDKNPEMATGGKPKFVMRPPQVLRVGTKKTSFANFMEICKVLHRLPKHLLDYLLSELGTSGSVDGNNQLIIKGRFQPKQIENVLRRYIKEYVTCHTCKSPHTILQKDTRLFFLQCESCGSRCSVASIKSGFQAVTSKRAAIRAKTA
ncbi:eukaryotic translation initiation factor 2 subunit 2 [Lutzomyia longipalpis]|uniref:eukaryotic translation initiation factor 2 subunit 2 n=1 Tax=Lutzomyia longipalpis TaxID=7200 RepID=UPI002483D85D|nr:eukaryotic translation initiation factor 2 subunit 2 [Lutzomyia longipalpis]